MLLWGWGMPRSSDLESAGLHLHMGQEKRTKTEAERACCLLETSGRWRRLDTASRQGGFVEDVLVEQKPERQGVTRQGPGCGGQKETGGV